MAQQRTFDIPAGSAAQSIPEFARQAGLQISAPGDALKSARTPAVKGPHDARAALRRMIQGSGLEIVSDDGQIIVLRARRAPPAPRAAAPPAEVAASTARAAALEEVVVTAQKRPERAQDVPISITALSSQTFEAFPILNLEDVSRITPGLLVSSFSPSSPTIAIRGANNTFSQVGVNKPVGVVIDDVFVTRNTAATFELFDIESIQVLKGPQGTLFGRNVSGGVVVINTRNPSFDDFGGSAQAEFGNYNARRFDALVNLPLGDNIAVTVSGSKRDRDGFGRDRLTGAELDDQHSENLRAKLRLRLSDSVEALLSADYAHDHNGNRTLSSRTLGNDGDRRTSEVGVPQYFARTIRGVSGRLTWETPIGQVVSITAYRSSESGDANSGLGTNWRFLTTGTQSISNGKDEVGAFSQEVRYASPKWDHGNFVAGLYLVSETASSDSLSQALSARTGILSSATRGLSKAHTLSYAAFIDGTVHLTSKLDLTAGVRYTTDEKEASRQNLNLLNPAANLMLPKASGTWTKTTPRVVLTWRPRNGLNVYGSISQGFTAGGFNADASSLAVLRTSFRPETLTNYELGVKSEWLERRLRLNAAVFEMKYKDKQERVQSLETGITTIFNAADATIKGFEAEVQFIPVEGLTLGANYGRLDTRYDDFLFASDVDYTGNLLGSTPRDKYALFANLDWPLGEHGFLLGTLSYSYTGRYNTGATDDPNLYVPAYALTNLSFGYAAPDRRWRIVGWVKNIGDVEYLLTPSSRPPVLAEYLGAPRTYGVTLGARF